MSTSRKVFGKHRAVLAHCLAFLVALLAIPGMAGADAGDLDPSFGGDGKIIGRKAVLVDMAKLRDGRIVVAGESAFYAYLANGKPDRSFGINGTVRPFAPTGRGVTIEAIAVDSRGRIVLTGSAGPTVSMPYAGGAMNYAAIERYLPSGDPDPSFGSNGAVITDFGLPLPVRPTGIPDYAQVSLPVDVQTSGVAVDSQGRIVVTGARAATYAPSKSSGFPSPEAFVARLTPNGVQDSTFNGTGTSQLPGLSSAGEPVLDRRDGTYVVASRAVTYQEPEPLARVGHLTAGGTMDAKFGKAGWRSVGRPFNAESRLSGTLDRQGRLLLFVGAIVERLKADGSADRGFGRKGVATIRSSNGEVSLGGLVPTGGEHILAVGTMRSRPKSDKAVPTNRLLLLRLTGDGRLDRQFGADGMVTTAFGRKSAPEGQAVLLDGGRVLAGGAAGYEPQNPFRFALARYLLGD